MTAVLFGLLGAVAIGVSDCVARVTAQRVALASLAAVVFGLGALMLALWCWATGAWPVWDPVGWRDAALSGVFNVIGLALLYAALARGPVALASPAVGVFSVLVVLFNALAGEPFVWAQGLAIVLVFLGIAMLARSDAPDERTAEAAAMEQPAHLRGTLLLALGAALAISLRMFLAQQSVDQLGAVQTLLLTRIAALLLALAALVALAVLSPRARPGPARMLWPPAVLWPLIVFQAALESAALAAFLTGGDNSVSAAGDRIGAAIGFSAFAAISPVVAWVWLGDPLSLRRSLWIALVVGGVALAALTAPG